MLFQAPPGAAPFTACLGLFDHYPLATTSRAAYRGSRSMVVMNRASGPPQFFVLTQVSDDLILVRSWCCHGIIQEIRPGQQVSGSARKVINESLPLPRDGALLGWVTDSEVTALLAVRCGQPDNQPEPAAVPEIGVLPLAGTSELLDWPPFAASPLGDGRLWEYVERGQIVDIVPLVTGRAGRAFWVPSPDRRRSGRERGSVVITENLPADGYWLPAGVFMDHWTLREGIPAPPAGLLLTLPGVVDLALGSRT